MAQRMRALLFQRTWAPFAAPTRQLTTVLTPIPRIQGTHIKTGKGHTHIKKIRDNPVGKDTQHTWTCLLTQVNVKLKIIRRIFQGLGINLRGRVLL